MGVTKENSMDSDKTESLTAQEMVEDILDEAEDSDTEQEIPGIERYEIGFYGIDYPVDALCKRLSSEGERTEGDIFIPDFQRGYIWKKRQADAFIESLLLGLPVPGIFLSTDAETRRRFVIDGGQRLRTIKSFVDGKFKRSDKFVLGDDVHADFVGKGYTDLLQNDRRRFDDTVIHATIVSQNEPKGNNRSLFYLFQRLNTGGTPATAHEVRRSLWGGGLNELLHVLAENVNWRSVYGPPSPRMKDQELILRFLALYVDERRYGLEDERTMKDFLNSFMARHRDPSEEQASAWRRAFEDIMAIIDSVFGRKAFRPEGRLNTAVYDAVMVGLAHAHINTGLPSNHDLEQSYNVLIENEEFKSATGSRTSHQPNVQKRLQLARSAFMTTHIDD